MAETPNFAIADALMWDDLAEKRDRKGSDWCETSGFGSWRRILADGRPTLFNETGTEQSLDAARARARVVIPAICKACGRCPWAKK